MWTLCSCRRRHGCRDSGMYFTGSANGAPGQHPRGGCRVRNRPGRAPEGFAPLTWRHCALNPDASLPRRNLMPPVRESSARVVGRLTSRADSIWVYASGALVYLSAHSYTCRRISILRGAQLPHIPTLARPALLPSPPPLRRSVVPKRRMPRPGPAQSPRPEWLAGSGPRGASWPYMYNRPGPRWIGALAEKETSCKSINPGSALLLSVFCTRSVRRAASPSVVSLDRCLHEKAQRRSAQTSNRWFRWRWWPV